MSDWIDYTDEQVFDRINSDPCDYISHTFFDIDKSEYEQHTILLQSLLDQCWHGKKDAAAALGAYVFDMLLAQAHNDLAYFYPINKNDIGEYDPDEPSETLQDE
jgi:hypothetical protein